MPNDERSTNAECRMTISWIEWELLKKSFHALFDLVWARLAGPQVGSSEGGAFSVQSSECGVRSGCGGQIRIPKVENRRKAEIRSPKFGPYRCLLCRFSYTYLRVPNAPCHPISLDKSCPELDKPCPEVKKATFSELLDTNFTNSHESGGGSPRIKVFPVVAWSSFSRWRPLGPYFEHSRAFPGMCRGLQSH